MKCSMSMNRTLATRWRSLVCLLPTIGLLSAMNADVVASTPGSDDASSSGYSSGWTNGSTGGSPFDIWTLNPTNNGAGQGFFIGNSAGNGGGDPGSDGDINVSSKAWGLYSNNGNTTDAVRKFKNGGMIVNQKFSIKFDNGWINSGGPSAGFGLQGTNGVTRFEFYFSGGDNQYRINDNTSTRGTGISWTDQGLSTVLTLTGTNTYSITITAVGTDGPGGGPWTITGTLGGTSNAPIDRVRIWNFNAGSGANYDSFINSLTLDCNGNPTTTAGSDSPRCVGDTLNLTATGDSYDTYGWSGPNTFSSTNQNPSISSVTTNTAGAYKVVRTKNGCASPTSTVSVVINTIPSVTASNGGAVCVGSTLHLFGNSATNGSFNWTGPNLFTSTQQNPTISNAQTNQAGQYTVWLTVNGCASSPSSTTATVVDPQAVAGSDSPQCSGSTLHLTATGSASDTYNWTGPNSFSSAAQNPTLSSATTNASGTYRIIRTSSVCGNASTSTVSVTINATPTTSASNNGPLCTGQTLSLTATGNGGDTYNWTGPNSFSSTNQNPAIVNATTAASGTYSVTRTASGCPSAAANTTATVNAPPPCGITGENPVGPGTAHTYSAPSGSGVTYSWTIGGNGSIVGASTSQTVSVNSGAAGTFTLNLTVGGVAGCSNSTCSNTVTVSACSISGPTSVHPLRVGYVYYALTGGSNYTWAICGPGSVTSTATNSATVSSAVSGSFTLTGSYIDVTGGTQTCNQVVSIASSAATVSTQHYDNPRSGANLQEYVLTPSNVDSNQFGKLFGFTMDGAVFAQPLYVSGLAMSNGTHNVVIVATEHNSVYAFDADAFSNALWQVNLGPSVPSADANGCTDLVPEIGVTGTPVINTNNNTLYVVDKTETVVGSTTNYFQYLHALDLVTGAEKFGGPVQISATVSNGTFNALHNLQRPALLLVSNTVYLAAGGICDWPPYNGWLIGYNGTNLQRTAAFCTTKDDNNGEGAIWQCGTGPAADTNGNIYVITGNGDFNANTGGPDYGDTFIKLSSALNVVDWFTPHDQATLTANDQDLGSGGAKLLPGTHLLVGLGKTGAIYLIDQNHMGHFAVGADTNIVQAFVATAQTDTIGQGPVYWKGGPGGTNQYIYLSSGNDTTKMFSFNGSTIQTSPVAQGSETHNNRAGGISLSADGTTNGILWVTDDANGGTFRAYDAANSLTELYNSQQNAARDSIGAYVKFSSPVVANGKVYVPTFDHQVLVFGLLNPSVGNPTPSGVITAPASVCQSSAGNTASVPNAGTQATYAWAVNNGASITAGTNTQAITWSAGSSSPVTISVTVSNSCGHASSNVVVTVNAPPAITGQPSPLIATNHVGQSITNSVTATGTSLTYQWNKTVWATNGWTFSTTSGDPGQNGFFIGSSANNGTAPSGNIDSSGVAWGIYANNSNLADAVRPFYGAMATGQTFQIDMDNGFITGGGNPGAVGFGLRTAAATNRFELYFKGGSANYFINDSRGLDQDTGVAWTDGGIHAAFTQTGPDTYSVKIVRAGVTNTITGTLAGPSGTTITNLRLFDYNAGNDAGADAFFNNLSWLNRTDNAADAAYANGWTTGSNGGSTTITGATNATYIIPSTSLNDAGVYSVVISGPACPSVTSSSIVQTVINP